LRTPLVNEKEGFLFATILGGSGQELAAGNHQLLKA
jgi:hypothetical protein